MKHTPEKRSAQERADLKKARDFLKGQGITISEWAMSHGIPPGVVVDLLAGKTKAMRGKAREAAVLLGIKAKPNLIKRAA
ncbi:MAG TPA: hypothetical protein VF928_09340 [Usitatibacteraceae bacterium]